MSFKGILIICLTILVLFGSCDKKVSRSPVEPPAQEGRILINSEPSGFTIYLNNKNTGRKTPDSLIFMEAGEYEVTLKRNYFLDSTISISLSEDESSNIDINFYNNPETFGNLVLFSSPDSAIVSINDSLTSLTTPDTINSILPGIYKITYKKNSYRDVEFSVIVKSSQTLAYSEELRDTSVWIDYQVFNSGIASNSLSDITIDNIGVKWIGSLDAGLIKFDGLDFVNYNILNSSIPSNRILCLSVDVLNNIWVGTDRGIGIFNGISWTIFNRNNSELTSEIINSIKFDGFGTAWIGTSANLVKFDGINWTIYNDPLERDWINDMTIISENEIWLATSSSGILKFENGIYSAYPKSNYNYPTYAVSSTAKDAVDNIWFCFLQDTSGRSGVSYWDGTIFNNFFIGSANNLTNDVYCDDEGNKWISTNEGLSHFNNSNVSEFFRTQNSLISSDNIRATVEDEFGHIWITTFGGGLNKYKPPQ